jgi:hypothetical protein
MKSLKIFFDPQLVESMNTEPIDMEEPLLLCLKNVSVSTSVRMIVWGCISLISRVGFAFYCWFRSHSASQLFKCQAIIILLLLAKDSQSIPEFCSVFLLSLQLSAVPVYWHHRNFFIIFFFFSARLMMGAGVFLFFFCLG